MSVHSSNAAATNAIAANIHSFGPASNMNAAMMWQ